MYKVFAVLRNNLLILLEVEVNGGIIGTYLQGNV